VNAVSAFNTKGFIQLSVHVVIGKERRKFRIVICELVNCGGLAAMLDRLGGLLNGTRVHVDISKKGRKLGIVSGVFRIVIRELGGLAAMLD
jgi:hypothetical protein